MTTKTMTVRDPNGRVLRAGVRREDRGWGVTVWFGGANSLGTNVTRYYYRTRRQAQDGCVSDDVGERGRIG